MAFPTSEVKWESSYQKALERAQQEKKPVLLDFFSEDCVGSARLNAVTYPDFCVATALNEFFVPLRLDCNKDDLLARQFRVLETPSINVLDPGGNVLYRVEGWLPPSDYVAMLAMILRTALPLMNFAAWM